MDDRALTTVVQRAGSIARTSTILRLGPSRHDLARAVAAGRLLRPARGWVCLPDTNGALQVAARAAVVLTCVTAAAELGLWVSQRVATPHVAAALHSTPRSTNAVVHWRTPPVPRHPDALVDPIENVLVIAATCQPFEDALAMWESGVEKGLVTLEAMGRLVLPPAARAVLAAATPWAGSGLESFVPQRLRWLRLPIRPQIWIAGHRADFLIGDRLVLQIDGGTHVGAQREADIAHDAALMLMGYHVIRVGYTQVVHRWHEVQDMIMRAVAQGLHRASASAAIR